MTSRSYPFSDLTSDQVQGLIRAARNEQAREVRNFFATLFSWRRATPAWPSRQRETQVWPPKNVPALSLTVYQ
jgi:hypothetical protein